MCFPLPLSNSFFAGKILPFFDKEIENFFIFFCFSSVNSTFFFPLFLLNFSNISIQNYFFKKTHCLAERGKKRPPNMPLHQKKPKSPEFFPHTCPKEKKMAF